MNVRQLAEQLQHAARRGFGDVPVVLEIGGKTVSVRKIVIQSDSVTISNEKVKKE